MPPVPSLPPSPAPGGPYIQNALLCEKVLRDADGVQSFIRIVDQITVSAVGPEPPDEMPPQTLDLIAAITLKTGDARGRYPLKFRPVGPDTLARPSIEVSLTYEGEGERGHNINVELKGLELDQAGLWWFDVIFGEGETERLMTRIPLRLRYQPQRVVLTGQADEPSEN